MLNTVWFHTKQVVAGLTVYFFSNAAIDNAGMKKRLETRRLGAIQIANGR
jgi:hypothetical protein